MINFLRILRRAFPFALHGSRSRSVESLDLFIGFVLTWGALLVFVPSVDIFAAPTSVGNLEQSLQRKEQEARSHEEILKSLSAQERKLFGNLQEVESRIRATTETLAELEAQLEQLRSEEKSIHADYRRLDEARDKVRDELRELLAVLWPVHVHGLEHNLRGLSSWHEADRQFTWLARIYELVQDRTELLRVQGRNLVLAQVRAEQVAIGIKEQLDRINASKDELLAQKLDFLRRVQEVRAQKVSAEEQVQEIVQSIAALNYQLKLLSSKNFTDFRGQMPWPGQGQVVEGFRPQADPPHRGVSLKMSENASVHVISWGKVVHSDVLRGYGHVVIVFHGQDYYSLYAFLNQVRVHVGQEVEKDEQIGLAGFYPLVDGPGLYFELRFHQNPVNPDSWLVAK